MRIFGLVIYELWKRFFLHSAWKVVIILAIFCLAWGGWSAGIFVADTYTKVAAFFEPGATIKQSAGTTTKQKPHLPKTITSPPPVKAKTKKAVSYPSWRQAFSDCAEPRYGKGRDGKCRKIRLSFDRDPWKHGSTWLCRQANYAHIYEFGRVWLCNLHEYKRRESVECSLEYEKGVGLWCNFVNGHHRNQAYLRQQWRGGDPSLREDFRTEGDVR